MQEPTSPTSVHLTAYTSPQVFYTNRAENDGAPEGNQLEVRGRGHLHGHYTHRAAQTGRGRAATGCDEGVIIGWMASRTGMNREYTPQKVNAAMKKLQFKPKKTNKGNVYFVVRLLADDLKHAGELLANQEFKKEVEADIPF